MEDPKIKIDDSNVPIIGKTDKPVVRNWVYRHLREDEEKFNLTDEAKEAHTVEKCENGHNKISIPACLVCGNPLVPYIKLSEGEQGIIEICPQFPMFVEQFRKMSEVVSKTFPKNAPCPCGSGLQYKRCHGKKADD